MSDVTRPLDVHMSDASAAGHGDPILQVQDLTVAYGGVVALRNVSLDVQPGHTVAVLGANGAGKTSLLRTISGLEEPASGRIVYDGQDITGSKPEQISRMRLGHVLDNRGIFPSLTVAENLRMGLYGAGRHNGPEGRESLERVHELFPILRERSGQQAGSMSGGQQQMLTIARALLQDPKLLMLDEMSMGLAPSIVDDLFDVVRELQREGIAVLLIEQFVGQAMGVAHDVVVLEQGRIVAQGTPAELAGDELAAAYLGGGEDVEIGEVPPPPPTVTEDVVASLGPRDVRALERLAVEKGVPVGEVLREAAHDLLGRDVSRDGNDR